MISAFAFSACGTDDDSLSGQNNVSNKHQEALTLASGLAPEDEVEPNSYIVTFKSDLTSSRGFFASYTAETKAFYADLHTRFLGDTRVKSLDFLTAIDLNLGRHDPLFQADLLPPSSLSRALSAPNGLSQFGVIAQVDFVDDLSAKEALTEWNLRGDLWFAEPNYISRQKQNIFDSFIERYQTNKQTWQDQVHLLGAYQYLAQSSVSPTTPIIAVMDSGVDFDHSHLTERRWINDQIGKAGCANDENGCNTTAGKKGLLGTGDVGANAADPTTRVCPSNTSGKSETYCSHGTHVAGIIAAYRNNDTLSVGGVCPMCQIMAIRVVGTPADAVQTAEEKNDRKGSILDSSIIRGLKYVSYFRDQNGFAVRVLNASFGKFQRSRAVSLLVRLLREEETGVVIVGAAGNEDSMKANYPAGYSDAIAVSNIHQGGVKHESSNFGRWVDIAAPGDEINSTVPGGTFERKTGTSMAAPVVAGVAGLLLSISPTLSYKEIRDRLILTSDASTLYGNDVNAKYFKRFKGEAAAVPLLGSGLVDAESAVKKELTENLPIVTALDRVTVSCGGIGGRAASTPFTILLLILPLLFASFSRRYAARRKLN